MNERSRDKEGLLLFLFPAKNQREFASVLANEKASGEFCVKALALKPGKVKLVSRRTKVLGARFTFSGRLRGAEIAGHETFGFGRRPTHRKTGSFTKAGGTAFTPTGTLGIKGSLFRGQRNTGLRGGTLLVKTKRGNREGDEEAGRRRRGKRKMLLAPRRTKFRKSHKRVSGLAQKKEYTVTECTFGRYGIRTLESSRRTAAQLEAARRVRSRERKREGKVWFRVFPSIPVTAKSVGVRRGKGKGSVSYWTSVVKAGRRIIELDGISPEKAARVVHACQGKRPTKLELVVLHSRKTRG